MAESVRELKELELTIEEERLARRAADPLYQWTPTSRQQPFIDAVLRGPTYTNFLVAANRSGKSDAGSFAGATLARFGVEPTRAAYSEGGRVEVRDRATSGWVISLDFPSSRDIVQPKYFDNGFVPGGASHPPFIPAREIARDGWRVSDQVLKLKNGSLIGFRSCESGRGKFQGAGKDWIHVDEEPPKDIYEESTIRVEAGRRLRTFATCTILPPEGEVGGVSWIFSDIIQPWQSGELPGVGVFGASIYDNPHLDPAEIDRLESMYPEGSVQRRIRLGGEWLPGLSGARAYVGFDRRLHVREVPPILPRVPLAWWWDFNVSPMVSGIGQKISRLFRVHRELVLDEGNVLEMVDWFRQLVPAHRAEVWIYGDATGRGRDAGTGKSDYQLILNAMRSYPAPVRLKVPEVNPHVADRINAVNAVCRDETGEVCLEVDPSCKELIADFEQVLRDVRGKIKKTSNSSDPYFRRTHISDACGYWLAYESPVRGLHETARRAAPLPPTPSYAGSA
jgi:phage terminase large subunit-like protein